MAWPEVQAETRTEAGYPSAVPAQMRVQVRAEARDVGYTDSVKLRTEAVTPGETSS